MNDNIYVFNGYTKNDINPDRVLESAIGECKKVLIIGYTKDGMLYVAASTANKGELLRLIESFKFKLMNGDYDE